MTHEQDPKPKPEVRISGAYEDFEGNREHLETVTRGELLKAGDNLPESVGLSSGVKVLNIVNAFGTPACDTYTRDVEGLFRPYTDLIGLVHVSKQAPDKMKLDEEKEGEITSPRLSITSDQAIDLGVELAPGEGADPDFWPTATRRTVIVADHGKIVLIEQPNNQDQEPNFQTALEAAQNALKQ